MEHRAFGVKIWLVKSYNDTYRQIKFLSLENTPWRTLWIWLKLRSLLKQERWETAWLSHRFFYFFYQNTYENTNNNKEKQTKSWYS